MTNDREISEIFQKFRTFTWISPMKGSYGVYYIQPSEFLSVSLSKRTHNLEETLTLLGRSIEIGLTSGMRTTPTPVFGIAFPGSMVFLYRKVVFDVERVGAILSSNVSSAMSSIIGDTISIASEFYEFPSSELFARFLSWRQSEAKSELIHNLAPSLDKLGLSISSYTELTQSVPDMPSWIFGIMEYWELISGDWILKLKEGAPVGTNLRSFVVKAL